MGIFGPRRDKAAKSTDPVCGLVVVERHAVGPEESAAGAVWFCSTDCQVRYRALHPRQQEGVEVGA
ncbi:MAG: hypothetical protein QOJ26_1643 [Thermoplasmata archaeon]|nr:hypothetical protein [Thermoplasmata archaeon]